jgi:hypothetical protein
MDTIELTDTPPTRPGVYWWCPTLDEVEAAVLVEVKPSPVVDGLLEARCNKVPHPFPGVLPRGYRKPAELGGWWSVRPLPRAVAPRASAAARP